MSNTKLKIHPRFSKVFRELTPEEKRTLEHLLLRDGVMDYIKTWNGYIVDGHNRYEICTRNNIKFNTIEMTELKSEDDVELWIRNFGSGRRNLTDYEKIENEERTIELEGLIAKAKEKQSKAGTTVGIANLKYVDEQLCAQSAQSCETDDADDNDDEEAIDTIEEIAKRAGVSRRQVAKFRKIKNEGTPDDIEKVKSGQASIGEIAKKVQSRVYREKESKLKDTTDIKINSNDVKFFNCDLLSADIPDNSLDAIITDPPYPREFLDCWRKLAEFAVKKLKDGGVLIALSGQSYLPDVYKNMTIEGLNYYWTGCVQHKRPTDIQNKKVKCYWKPYLWYVKGKYNKTFQPTDVFSDSSYEEHVEGQVFHKWGQSVDLFNQIIQKFTYADELVCDPFMGGGTTGLSCVNNKRKFIGIEILEENYKISRNRISELLSKEN